MLRFKRLLIVFLMILACAGCDQATKAMAKQYLPQNQVISLMKDSVRLDYVRNSGAFLSMGASLPINIRTLIFTVGVSVIVAGIFIYLLLAAPNSLYTLIGLSLICGGGVGNLIDRVAYNGAVVDFLNLGIGSLRTGIFNIADVAVLAGGLVILFEHTRNRRTADFTI
jgi:signal peptidase II